MFMSITSRYSTAAALMLSVYLLMSGLAGCGGGDMDPSLENSAGGRTLTWSPPDSYSDHTSLDPESDLSEYYIYVKETGSFSESDDPSAVVTSIDSSGNAVTSFNLMNLSSSLTPGATYYVSMRSVSRSGVVSDFSTALSFTL